MSIVGITLPLFSQGEAVRFLISSNIETALVIAPFIALLWLLLYLFQLDAQVIGYIVTVAVAALFFMVEKNLSDKSATDTVRALHTYNCEMAKIIVSPTPGYSYNYFFPDLYAQNMSYVYNTVGEEHVHEVFQAMYNMTYANALTRDIAATYNFNTADPALQSQATVWAERYSKQRQDLSKEVVDFCRKQLLPTIQKYTVSL